MITKQSCHGKHAEMKMNMGWKLSSNTWSWHESIVNLSINLRLTSLSICWHSQWSRHLTFFHGLSLGMGAWEGLTVEGVAALRKMGWITIWILLAGSEINSSAGGGGEITLESSENACDFKKWRGGTCPLLVMDTLLCIPPLSHYIHGAVKYAHANVVTGWVVVICIKL